MCSWSSSIDMASPSGCGGFRAAMAARTAASYCALSSSNQTSVTVCSHSSRKSLSYHFWVNSFMALSLFLASSVDGRGVWYSWYSSSVWYSNRRARRSAASCLEVICNWSLRLASERSALAWRPCWSRRSVLWFPMAYFWVRPDPPVWRAPPPRRELEELRASDIIICGLKLVSF